MSPPGRPKGEYRSAQHEGNPVRPPGRPKGEYRSAQHEGNPVRPPGRPKGECRSAQHEAGPVRAPGSIGAGTGLLALAAMRCRRGAPRLGRDELDGHLAALAGWTFADNRIEKTFRFANYHETMAFVNAVAYVAQREDHHPDLAVGYDRCGVMYTTHDAGGVTVNDCICAAKIERLA
jgi:4a-hydroxytetrahydrobiopterin dehydratase